MVQKIRIVLYRGLVSQVYFDGLGEYQVIDMDRRQVGEIINEEWLDTDSMSMSNSIMRQVESYNDSLELDEEGEVVEDEPD